MIKSLQFSKILVQEGFNPESKDVTEHRSIPEVDKEQFLFSFSSLFFLVLLVLPLDFPEHGIQPISLFDLLLLLQMILRSDSMISKAREEREREREAENFEM